MSIIYTIIVMMIMLFIITFSLENTANVTLHYLHYQITVKTFILLFVTFLAGVIFAGFMGIVERFRLSRTINKLNKTIRELRRDIRANESPAIIENLQQRTSAETDTNVS
jgi:uncharacterized integral membrane protein